MFKILNETKQSNKCHTVTIDKNDEYVVFSEGSILKIYNKCDAHDILNADPVQIFSSNNDIINARFNNTGDKLAIANMDYTIEVYDAFNYFSKVTILQPGSLKTWKFEFSPIKNELATGCYSIMIFDIDSNEMIYEIPNDLKYIYSLCYIDSQHVAAGNLNGSITIYSLDTMKRIHKIEDNTLTIRSLQIDNKNERLIAASDDLHISIIDRNKFKRLVHCVGHKDFISSLSVNSNLNIYASGSYDGTVRLWDVRQAKCVQTISIAHLLPAAEDCSNSVWDLCFSNDGHYLYVASEFGLSVLTT